MYIVFKQIKLRAVASVKHINHFWDFGAHLLIAWLCIC